MRLITDIRRYYEDLIKISEKNIQSWIVDEKEVDTQGDFHVFIGVLLIIFRSRSVLNV